jgi:uncharacterized protein YjdB
MRLLRSHTFVSDRALAALSCSVACLIAACHGPMGQEPAPKVDVLQVLPASGTLIVGESANLGSLRLHDRMSTNVTADVEWSSDDETILEVSYDADAGAVVTAVGPGTGHITAKDGNRTATAEFVVMAAITSIELDKGLFELAEGTTLPLGAIMISSDGAKHALEGSVSWGSSDAAVATVDEDGLVTGVAAGDAIITLTREGLSASEVAHVRDWTLESIDATAVSGTTLPFALSTQIQVLGTFSGGHTQDITSSFDLAFEAASDAAMDEAPLLTVEDGTVTAGSMEGMTTLTGTGLAGTAAADQTFTLDFTVQDAPLTALTLELPAVLSVGGDVATATITGTYGDDNLEFDTAATLTADPPDPVSIDNLDSTIKPLAAGMTTITASVVLEDGDDDPTTGPTVETTQDIEVVEDGVDMLTVVPDSASLAVAATTALTATATYGSSEPVDVSEFVLWKSADETIAVVSNVTSGRVTGIAAGTVTLTATYRGKSTDVAVTVTP